MTNAMFNSALVAVSVATVCYALMLRMIRGRRAASRSTDGTPDLNSSGGDGGWSFFSADGSGDGCSAGDSSGSCDAGGGDGGGGSGD